jgi:hypothetical protein
MNHLDPRWDPTQYRLVLPAVAKLLATFIMAYRSENNGKKSWFRVDYVQTLTRSLQRLRVAQIWEQSKLIPGQFPGKNGYFYLMRELASLSGAIAQEIGGHLAAHNTGYLVQRPQHCQAVAAEMVVKVCKMIEPTRGTTILLRELEKMSRKPLFEVINPLVDALGSATGSRISAIANEIMRNVSDPRIFTEAIGRLLIAVAERGEADRGGWAQTIAKMLASSLKNPAVGVLRDEVAILVSFVPFLNGTAIQQIEIDEAEERDLLEKVKGVKMQDGGDLSETLRTLLKSR